MSNRRKQNFLKSAVWFSRDICKIHSLDESAAFSHFLARETATLVGVGALLRSTLCFGPRRPQDGSMSSTSHGHGED